MTKQARTIAARAAASKAAPARKSALTSRARTPRPTPAASSDSAGPPAAEASPAKVDTRRIELLVDKNPRREGTGRHAQFEVIMACADQTAATATERGATSAAIASATRHGWVRLVEGEGGE
jgi:hypothetical protein